MHIRRLVPFWVSPLLPIYMLKRIHPIVLDATRLLQKSGLQQQSYTKVFSNAAMHWILRPPERREDFFRGIYNALEPSGVFVFEMGGMGNVAEMHAALLSVVGRRIGMERARQVDPWFFPDEAWMKRMLEVTVGGFRVERSELQYRPTKSDAGGIRGWVKLMGKQFFDALDQQDQRGECEDEVCEALKTVCGTPDGDEYIGYVRLRVLARKI